MYTVRWTVGARNELTTIWLAATSSDRAAVNAATDHLDELLSRNPLREGESRPDNRRITFAPPLGLVYSVDEEHRIVRVLHIWRIDKTPI
jgi:hypothetical protein